MSDTVKPHFDSRAQVEWMPDGRSVQLVRPLVFIDSTGYRWEVYEGTVVDGSSIPRPLWPLSGSPFVGRHREASIPHDLYCRERVRAWEDTHKMYYNAMICSGVSERSARTKLWWLMRCGPRWDPPVSG